ncbi:hypothetical protein BX600DRAFT_489099 [Xylariales sp. PMI_506]|nr:hypothetical protein BX600DRAFT_489099 [Xylariales sp. PMI_506]
MASAVGDAERLSSHKSLRCVIIGAGFSGILMAYKLQTHLPDHVEIRILEKNPEVGGTWYENRYPGCACDVPSHVYQFTFAPNPYWSKFYSSSEEIQHYLKSVCTHFDLEKYITFNTTVTNAVWNDEAGQWLVDVQSASTDSTSSLTCDILVNASGILNNFKYPGIRGLQTFAAGPILHTAAWDSSVSLRGKRVAIIGAGASALQVLPAIRGECASVDVYIRTPSWISPPTGLDADTPVPNPAYPSVEQERWRDDAEFSLSERKRMEAAFNTQFRAFFKDAPEQREMRARFEKYMRDQISDPELQERLIPNFEAGCRRINPSSAYLEALQADNVRAIFEPIEEILPNGVMAGGQNREVDVVICATGFDTSFRPRFPIIGKNGVDLRELWSEEAVAYMGTGVSGFPNYLIFLGPNTPISNGSLIGPLEATSDYFVRLMRKMARERVKYFDVKKAAQDDFDAHTQDFMKDAVWTGACRSWFKRGRDGRVSALWPGSSLHYMQTLSEDRWHDYDWAFRGNRFGHWGKGFSWVQDPAADQLGADQVDALTNTYSRPQRTSDHAYYIGPGEPLPEKYFSNFSNSSNSH